MEATFECPCCNEYFIDVVETPCCHQCYCRKCIERWIIKAGTCPHCRAKIGKIAECTKNIPLQRYVGLLCVWCCFVCCLFAFLLFLPL